ncbi:MAG: hypothetical protein GY936_01455 [Ignavibacteriae bacterium]|nr:hypothetical protein [Ignavibacteriota bacterium]
MNKIYILNIIILLSFFSIINAQNLNIEEKVIGIVISDSAPVLVTESNYLQLKNNNSDDVWLKYYQEIYNDTTLTNPNLELKSESNLSIIPIIDFDYSQENFSQFNSNIPLKDIIIIDNFGNYVLSSKGEELVNPFLNHSTKKIKK